MHGGEQRVTMEFSRATPDLSDTYECRFIRGKMITDAIKAEIRGEKYERYLLMFFLRFSRNIQAGLV